VQFEVSGIAGGNSIKATTVPNAKKNFCMKEKFAQSA